MKLRVMIDDQAFEVEVGDLNARPIVAMVDGEPFEVWPDENATESNAPSPEIPIPSAPAPAAMPDLAADERAKTVLAPIPGVIIAVKVREGDAVGFGQELCVLEAMKMKNQIRANRSGKIGAIYIAVGDQVKHNQMLMEYSPEKPALD